ERKIVTSSTVPRIASCPWYLQVNPMRGSIALPAQPWSTPHTAHLEGEPHANSGDRSDRPGRHRTRVRRNQLHATKRNGKCRPGERYNKGARVAPHSTGPRCGRPAGRHRPARSRESEQELTSITAVQPVNRRRNEQRPHRSTQQLRTVRRPASYLFPVPTVPWLHVPIAVSSGRTRVRSSSRSCVVARMPLSRVVRSISRLPTRGFAFRALPSSASSTSEGAAFRNLSSRYAGLRPRTDAR